MRYLLTSIILFSASAQAATLVDLSSNQSSYAVGQLGILKATVACPPTNNSSELYFEARLNGEPIKIVNPYRICITFPCTVFCGSGQFPYQEKAI